MHLIGVVVVAFALVQGATAMITCYITFGQQPLENDCNYCGYLSVTDLTTKQATVTQLCLPTKSLPYGSTALTTLNGCNEKVNDNIQYDAMLCDTDKCNDKCRFNDVGGLSLGLLSLLPLALGLLTVRV